MTTPEGANGVPPVIESRPSVQRPMVVAERQIGRTRVVDAASNLQALQQVGHESRDGAALAAGQGHVGKERMPLERLDDRGNTVVPADSKVVTLGHVMGEDDPGVLPDPRKNREQDVPLERLGLVDDDERVVQGPASDMGEGQHLEHPPLQDLLDHLGGDDSR